MLIRVNDNVIVLAGRDAGQKGKVLQVDREKNRVVVEGLNRVYKHVKRSQRNPQGGRLSKEVGIDASNVAIIDPQSGKPTRIGVRFLPDGSKERYSKKSGVTLGVVSPARASRAKQA
ncbi:MAG: 50S ribosomal protein L24 [Pirellulaceae bacterium]|nr:50S ribosomal protein L24 [Pirellulaceae bacterium]